MTKDRQPNPDPQNSAPPPSISEAPASSPELDRLAVEADQVRPDMAGAPAPDAGGGGAPAAPEKPDTVRMLRGVIAPLFMYLAPAWKITADEVDLLSQAYAAVLDKYFPEGVNLGPEINAILVTLMVFGPRWHKPRKDHPPPASGPAPPRLA